jgi:hypothetical protein
MGKSEKKSKWKKKFRAIKREKNKTKELLKLKTILESKPLPPVIVKSKTNKIDVDLDVNKQKNESENQETMQMDPKDDRNIYNSKTKLNVHGNYPVWMNSRSIKKLKKRLKPNKKK